MVKSSFFKLILPGIQTTFPMAANDTRLSSRHSLFPPICFSLPVKLKFPDEATPSTLASSCIGLVITGFSAPLSVALNFLVLFSLYKKPQLRSKFTVIIGAVALTDLLGSVSVAPLYLFKEALFQAGKDPNCSVNIAFFATKSILNFSGVGLVTALNVERLLSIRYVVWHHNNISKRGLVGVCVVCWVVGLILSAVRIFYNKGKPVSITTLMINTSVTLLIALLTWKSLKKRNKIQSEKDGEERVSRIFVVAERKAAKLAMYLSAGFTVTRVVPLILMLVLAVQNTWVQVELIEPIFQALCFVNFFLDPVIFGLMNSELKKTMLQIAKCKI